MADAIADGQVVGWFQGRMEFGPRALGARSLLGDPRRAEMQTVMNMKVKFREGFRPFAPSVLREHVSEYFDAESNADSPYMLLVFPVAAETRRPLDAAAQQVQGIDKLKVQRSTIPAVTHVDFSARLQTIDSRSVPALSPVDHGVPREDRLSGRRQHELQSWLGSDRLHPARRVRHLHVLRHRRTGDGPTASSGRRRSRPG